MSLAIVKDSAGPPALQQLVRRKTRGALLRIDALARRRRVVIAAMIVISFLVNVLAGIRHGVPVPQIHDEFSYLLAADTFAHGRLTNPSPPAWEHFQSMHILASPSYVSKYPPAQGMFLALGQVATGYPIVGVWLSVALLSGAVAWMLYVWTSPRMALLGGFFALATFGIFHPWCMSYWGGGVHALGAAVLLGSVRRMIETCRARYAVLFALSLVLLAWSRPYEGLAFALPAIVTVLGWLVWGKGERGKKIRGAVIPACVVIAAAAAWTGYFNYRVTGSAATMPYAEYSRQYDADPLLLWGSAIAPKQYSVTQMTEFYAADRSYLANLGDLGQMRIGRIKMMDSFFGGTMCLPREAMIALVAVLVLMGWRSWMRLPLAMGASVFLANMEATFYNPHYSAAVVPVLFLGLAQGARHVRAIRWARIRVGGMVLGVLVCCWGMDVVRTVGRLAGSKLSPAVASVRPTPASRAREVAAAYPGKHLIVCTIRNASQAAWTYNPADWAGAAVLFAQSRGEQADAALQRAFPDRHIWTLDPTTGLPPVHVRGPVTAGVQ